MNLFSFQLSQLCKRLDEIAQENEGEVLLFLWTSFLQEETLDYLEIQSPLDLSNVVIPRTLNGAKAKPDSNPDREQNTKADNTLGAKCETSRTNFSQNTDGNVKSFAQLTDPRAVQDIARQDLLMPFILEFNQQRRERVFQTTSFTCEVCFQEKLGDVCMTFVGK